VLGTLRKAGGSRDRAVMVGDSQTEIPMARLAPDKIISDFSMLHEIIGELLKLGASPVSSLAPVPIGPN
jgi:hypothetical protein